MGGYAGMFSFGQVAFFGIGAYTSSFLLLTFNVTPWIGLVAGGIISSLAAACIGYPALNCAVTTSPLPPSPSRKSSASSSNNWKMVGAAEGLTIPMLKESLGNFYVPFLQAALLLYYAGLPAACRDGLLPGIYLQDRLLSPGNKGKP